MAKIVIGGEEYEGNLVHFKQLRLAWPYLERAKNPDLDHMERVSLMIAVVAIAVGQDPATFEDKVLVQEVAAIPIFFQFIVGEGFPSPGEAKPGKARAKPSTATSTPSSPNSSRRASKAAAGTA